MKKFTILIAALMLVCFAVPALAVDWNFYGSARINTWYVSRDFDEGLNDAGTDTKDSEVRWGSNGQDNSRIGARVKHENVSGRVEIQLRGDVRRIGCENILFTMGKIFTNREIIVYILFRPVIECGNFSSIDHLEFPDFLFPVFRMSMDRYQDTVEFEPFTQDHQSLAIFFRIKP